MKWICSVILFLVVINSCSIERHLLKAQKHIDIAKRKGAVIKSDTIWAYKYEKEIVFDTITNRYTEIITKDSTIYSVNNLISPGISRQERVAIESYYKHLEKMMKLSNDSLSKQLRYYIKSNRQNNKTERTIVRQENKQPWAWVILAAIMLVIILVVKRIFKL